jgi:hypothetical protein
MKRLRSNAEIVAQYDSMPQGQERLEFSERHIKELSESVTLPEDVKAGRIRLHIHFRELGWFDPDRSELYDRLFTIAWTRAQQMDALKKGDNKTATEKQNEYAQMTGEIAEKFAKLGQFAKIEELAEILRDPQPYLKFDRPAFLEVGEALADYIETHGHPPKSQAELVALSGRSKDTVSRALRWLGIDLRGTPGPKG